MSGVQFSSGADSRVSMFTGFGILCYSLLLCLLLYQSGRSLGSWSMKFSAILVADLFMTCNRKARGMTRATGWNR